MATTVNGSTLADRQPSSTVDVSVSGRKVNRRRNRQFDVLRITFATLVLLAHAPELTDGNTSRELFTRLTHSNVTFGTLAVDGFFLLSGYLIVQSWADGLWDFLRNRVLRIVPGYLVAVLLTTAVVGLLAPGVPHFFRHFHKDFIIGTLYLSFPRTPPVFPGLSHPIVNGPLWTINYEFRCYLLVALFGVLGLLKRPLIWLALTAFLIAAMISPSHLHLNWHFQYFIFGNPNLIFRLSAAFYVGGCYFLFKDRIPYRPVIAMVAGVALIACMFVPWMVEPGLVIFGSYLMFYFALARIPLFERIGRFPDISYGIYLYGWPVESLIIWYLHPSPWITFAAATVICIGIAWASWEVVERPMLKLKRRSIAPLPDVAVDKAAA